MTTNQLAQTVVGKIVARQPAVARVFEKYQIDYCCRGAMPLEQACQVLDLDIDQIVAEIRQVQSDPAPDETDWNAAPLSELADHIVETHHQFLLAELPRIAGLIDKVERAHGQTHSELAELAQTFAAMQQELLSHMAKEENILFPAIRTLSASTAPVSFPFGSVDNPIRLMVHEHDSAGAALRRLRELTNEFAPPPDACPTYRVMLESLANLERDLHLHIHKENNILFPRAQACQRAPCGA